jgi:hypothetical protein
MNERTHTPSLHDKMEKRGKREDEKATVIVFTTAVVTSDGTVVWRLWAVASDYAV